MAGRLGVHEGSGSGPPVRDPIRMLHGRGGPADAIHRAEWCYSGDGLLLFALDQVEGGRATIAEATEVSPGVSDRDFIVPSTRNRIGLTRAGSLG